MINEYIYEKSGRCPKKAWLLCNVDREEEKPEAKAVFPKMPKGTEFDKTFVSSFGQCTVGAVVQRGDGVELYDFHESVKIAKFFSIMNYKRAVVEDSGVKVRFAAVITVNPEYPENGKLYTITKVEKLKNEKDFIKGIRKIDMSATNPKMPKGEMTNRCSGCEYFGRCFNHIPKKNIFQLINLSFEKKLELYKEGIVSFDDYMAHDPTPLCAIQIEGEKRDIINKKEIAAFLGSLSYPLGFLDFETIMPLKPEFEGYHPRERIVTQFSYHKLSRPGGELTHSEFIGDGVSCPEEELIIALIKAVGDDKCILMYSNYEKTCIEMLMKRFPKYRRELKKIRDRLIDLEVPFKNKFYYNRRMEGRSSLKYVLPALYPDEKNLDYHELPVSDGEMAISAYMCLKDLPSGEREKKREELLKYCALDTMAMVKIIEKLNKVR